MIRLSHNLLVSSLNRGMLMINVEEHGIRGPLARAMTTLFTRAPASSLRWFEPRNPLDWS